mgnify:CR=1 FL=1
MAWFKIIKDLTKNRPIIYGGTCALIGYQFGIKHQRESANRALPSGFPKTCSHEYDVPFVRKSKSELFVDLNGFLEDWTVSIPWTP